MAELKEGERARDYSMVGIKKTGFCTLQELANHLGCERRTALRYAEACGIHLEPAVRREWYMTKVYKWKRRQLTREEAEAVIKRYAMVRGKKLEDF